MKLYLARCTQNAKNTKYPDCVQINSLDDLNKAVEKDHIAVRMKDDYRNNDNFIESDCVMMDLDNTHSHTPWDWKNRNDVEETFQDVLFYAITSRNCYKEKVKTNTKTGEVTRYEPRYKAHFYFPLSRTYTDQEEYKALMLKAAALFPYFDMGACKPAQFFFGGIGQSEKGAHNYPDGLFLDEFLETVSPEDVVQSITDFATKVHDGVYEPINDETQKAINRLCSEFHITLPDNGYQQQPISTYQVDAPYSDEEGLKIARVEQQKSLAWFKEWAEKHHVPLGESYNINSKDHPEGICICTLCPWEDKHTEDTGERQTVVIIDLGGKLNYLCRHGHCMDKGWKDFRTYYDALYPEAEEQSEFTRAAEEGFMQDNGDMDIPFENLELPPSQQTKPELPPLINFANQFKFGLPDLEPVVLDGVLRKGGKMLITASSKAGKTQLLALLTIDLAVGGQWLDGIQCLQSKVLYVNFELSPAQMLNRFKSICWEKQIHPENTNFDLLNLKGRYDLIFPLDQNFVPRLITTIKKRQYDVVVLDPIYKMFQADENSSETIAEFGRYTDQIISETGCSLIYSHHHSKGAQGGKNAMDRGSGSGVFARDADAVVDLLEIEPKDCDVTLEKGEAAFRVEFGGLRSFQRKESFEVVSHYPLFHVRSDLKEAKAKYGCGDASTNARRGNQKKQEKRDENISILRNFVKFSQDAGKPYSVEDAAEAMDKSRQTIRNYVSSEGSGMAINNNNIYLTMGNEPKKRGIIKSQTQNA